MEIAVYVNSVTKYQPSPVKKPDAYSENATAVGFIQFD
jgi:hypothetical protein